MLHRNVQCPRRLKSLLSACKYKRSITQVHAFTVATGISLHGSSFLGDLIASYGRIGEISHARKMFDALPHRNVSAYNSMTVAYSRGNNPEEVVRLYDDMIAEGVRPDSSTFTVTIKACVTLMIMEKGETVWGKAVETGYGNDVFVCSSVLNLYTKCRKMDEAKVLFGKMTTKKDVICWTTMVTGFAQAGEPRKALEFYREMETEGVAGAGVVMLGLLQACADLGDWKTGLSVHGYMIRRDLPTSVVVETSLVDMYAKVGFLELACRVFNLMTNKNAVSWAALISGFAQNGFAWNALETLVEMQNRGFQPNLVSLVGVLLACSKAGSLKTGKSIHCYILKRHVVDRVSATALMDMYSKCGALSCARAIFDQVERKDLISWNTMISCYGIHGNGREALSLVLHMTEANIEPDHATFASLLSALSHADLVEQGKHWFSLMINKYNIQPSEKHYACMVDLLARAGRAEEALDMINSASLDPSLPIWDALLSGCINHRNFSVGNIAANKILELKPNETGVQALVSNFCFLPSARSFVQLPSHFANAEQRNLRNTRPLLEIPFVSSSLDFLQGQRPGVLEHNGVLGRCFFARYMSNTTIELQTDADVVRFAFNKTESKYASTRKEKKMKRTKMSRKAKLNELRFYRLKAKKKINSPNPEVRIRYKLEKAKRKEEWLIEKLRKYEVPKAPAEPYDPEILTEEEKHYLKRTGEKRKNFAIVGRRGVFGGVVLNMHLHWKKHETVKIICKPCKPGQIHEYAEELTRLSKGIVIDIKPNNTIIFYRGKNYARPEVMSPTDTLSKEKALEKYRYEQSLEHTSEFIEKLEKELEEYQKYVARYKKKKEEEASKKKEDATLKGVAN